MAQTKEGAAKIAAQRFGIPHLEYILKTGLGLKFCGKCRRWLLHKCFNREASRGEKYAVYCRLCLNGPGTKSDKLKASWAKRGLSTR